MCKIDLRGLIFDGHLGAAGEPECISAASKCLINYQ